MSKKTIFSEAKLTGSEPDIVMFKDIWFFWANVVDYFRYVLCVVATFTLFADCHISTAVLLIVSFLLDIVDGKVARAYNQCSVLGDGLDWGADLYVNILLMVWWGRLEPVVFPFLMLCTMVEVVAALYDFAMLACDKYPPRSPQSGICIIIEWAIPAGRYTDLGWVIWLAYPHFVAARCLYLADSIPMLAPILMLIQLLLVVPSGLFHWCNLALLITGFNRWEEKNKNKKTKAL
jgi:phosphatidylglycerophosphate synthase